MSNHLVLDGVIYPTAMPSNDVDEMVELDGDAQLAVLTLWNTKQLALKTDGSTVVVDPERVSKLHAIMADTAAGKAIKAAEEPETPAPPEKDLVASVMSSIKKRKA